MIIETVGSFLADEKLLRYDESLAVTDIIERQIACGLTYVTSGEVRRKHWANDFWFGLSGLTCHKIDSGHIYQQLETSSDLLRITGRIAHNPNHPFYNDFKNLYKTVAHRAICRQSLPSPANLLLEIYALSDGHPENLYRSEEDLIADIASAYRDTLMKFYEFGCLSMQYDDTAFGLMCDDNYTKRLLQGGVDLLKLHEDLIKVINCSLKDIPSEMELSIYMSGGDNIVPEWEYIPYPDNVMPKVLSQLSIDKFFLPFNARNEYSFEILRHIPNGKNVVLGLIDAHSPFPDNIQILISAIKKAENMISPTHIGISPMTGFRLSNYLARGLTYEDQWRKINEMIKVFN